MSTSSVAKQQVFACHWTLEIQLDHWGKKKIKITKYDIQLRKARKQTGQNIVTKTIKMRMLVQLIHQILSASHWILTPNQISHLSLLLPRV